MTQPEPSVLPHVLIVDDHPAQRHLYSLLTENLSIDTQIVSCCQEALKALTQGKFDLILMDWQMPDIDGLMCAATIRKEEQRTGLRIPIVAVTAHVLPGDREKCLEAGMDDYLGKPFTMAELKATIERWSKAGHPSTTA